MIWRGASIGGQLSCVGGQFINPSKTAINADRATIAASVYLRKGFRAEGEVIWRGASIGGQLSCVGGQFINPGKTAIQADAATIAADVYLRNGFRAEGELNWRGAAIGGQLDCSGGQFINPGKTAIKADAATIAADVYLRNGFRAEGELNWRGAAIGGQLDCSNGQFVNPGKTAINAGAATIAASVFLSEGFRAEGEVNFIGASIGGQLDCSGGQFSNPGKTAISADFARIGGSVSLSAKFRAEGAVNWRGATIKGQLFCIGGQFINPDKTAIDAESANIGGSVFLGGQFTPKGKDPSWFQAEGTLDFYNAVIGSELALLSTQLNHPEKLILNLRFAKANTFCLEGESNTSDKIWAKQLTQDHLFLNGFVYSAFIYGDIEDSPNRQCLLAWLRLQPEERFALQPYEQLAAVLKAKGHQAEATAILIGKEEDRRKRGGLTGWNWVWNRILGATIAHGYRPQQALLYSLAMILIGWGVFSANKGLMAETSDKPKPYVAFNPFMYSVATFTPIIDFQQKSTWIPDPRKGREVSLLVFKVNQGELLLYYFWFQIAAGWVLTSLWVAGFTGLVRSQK